jgi:hypothetical protein
MSARRIWSPVVLGMRRDGSKPSATLQYVGRMNIHNYFKPGNSMGFDP